MQGSPWPGGGELHLPPGLAVRGAQADPDGVRRGSEADRVLPPLGCPAGFGAAGRGGGFGADGGVPRAEGDFPRQPLRRAHPPDVFGGGQAPRFVG